jgi:hypothetical protein
MVTVFDGTPPIEITTGTAAPLVEPAGTRAFTWYSPAASVARPENCTTAGAPPAEFRIPPGFQAGAGDINATALYPCAITIIE